LIFGISWLPMIALFRQGAEQAWFLWVPALAQSTLMNRVLRGESVGWVDTLPPMLICVLVTAVCLADLSFQLRATATRN
jgi:sodium transport system permease protein